MKNKRIIPRLMLAEGELYNSTLYSAYKYIGDPINAVKIFNDKEVHELSIVDIDPSKTGTSINFNLLKEIATECFMPISYGGGIDCIQNVQRILYLGYEKVIINSAQYSNPNLLRSLVDEFGGSTIISSIDYHSKTGQLYSHSLKKKEKVSLIDQVQKNEQAGVGEIMFNSIDLDGTKQGLDINTISLITKKVSTPSVFSGGTGSIEHIALGFKAGADAIGIGSMSVLKGNLDAVLINYPSPEIIKNNIL